MTIRCAAPGDAAALLEIYRPYVENTAVSFEYDTPSELEFARRIAHTLESYPYLVLEDGGAVRGYAYAGPLKARAAYAHAAEVTIYLAEDARGRGYGRALYTALEDELRRRDVKNLYACIAWAEEEDAYLTHASPDFHAHMGFHRCAHFRQCGIKFGRWYDIIWMEKMIGDHSEAPESSH